VAPNSTGRDLTWKLHDDVAYRRGRADNFNSQGTILKAIAALGSGTARQDHRCR
jgi:hypothetical protein